MDDTTAEVRWLTTAQVGVRCGVPTGTVRGWRKGAKNIGPTFHRLTHNTVRYRESDVDAWLAEKAVKTEAAQ